MVVNDDALCSLLVNSLLKTVGRDVLTKFIRTYLLEAIQPHVRWTMHSLIYSIYKNSTLVNQDQLYEILIQFWPDALCSYGIKASQYVDLLGYMCVRTSLENQTRV